MARGINKVILVGNVGADPDIRTTASGSTITTLSVATSEQWTDKQSGQKQERTEWHRVKFFNRLGEIAGEYVHKGRQIYIEGGLRTDKFTDANGIERYSTYIVGNELQLLGGNPNQAHEGGGRGQPQQAQAPRQQAAQRQPSQPRSAPARAPAQAPQHQQVPEFEGAFDSDRDIPF